MSSTEAVDVAVIGGGPAGLMAAEAAAAAGASVTVFERQASAGRKLLLAGKGGLNLTHAEPAARFLTRFDAPAVQPIVADFDATAIRAWSASLGVDTVVGTSQRVFPQDFKAAPLLRRWLQRLRAAGVRFAMRHRWRGWQDDSLLFETPDGARRVSATATVLALGGASWPRLGSDGSWVELLAARGVGITPLAPANCGFEVAWSTHLRTRFAGTPVKSVRGWTGETQAAEGTRTPGELVLTEYGLEGGLVYALSGALRRQLEREGRAILWLDLTPGVSLAALTRALAVPRGSRSLATHLRRRAHLEGVKVALLHERLPRAAFDDAATLAGAIKALPIELHATRPLAEAISTAGGVAFDGLAANLMLQCLPGVFVAGEMLDWAAPTGGYLLSGCLATGRRAGQSAAAWARRHLRP